MAKPVLVVLAAGMGSRYGGLKQVDPVGPDGETLMDYAVFDAVRAGFDRFVFVIRRDFEEAFKRDVASRYAGRVAVGYAYQEMSDLPAGFAVPEGRAKPWGTAHAIRAGRNEIRGPFAAINADDFYGAASGRARAGHLSSDKNPAAHCMVAFRLGQTLSEHGSVSRGVCLCGPDRRLAAQEAPSR